MQTGLSRQIAETVAELYDADQRSILQPKGDRKLNGTTPIDETLRDFVRSIA